jgi:flagellar FliJ protein
MRRYRFRLESVLRVRRVQEDLARADLARATTALAAAQQGLAGARSHLAGLDTAPRPAEAAGWEAHRRVVLTAAGEVADAVTRVADAASERDARQGAAAQARTRVRALECLDDRRRAEHALEAARHDDRTVDDLVTARWSR